MSQLSQEQTARSGPRRTNRPGAQRSHTRGDAAIAALAALLAALAWLGARAADVEPEVRSGSGTSDVKLVSVLVVSLIVSIAGAGLLRLLEVRTPQARRVWTVVAVLVWVLSFAGPLSATHLSGGLVLAGMHLLVGTVVIVGLRLTHEPSPVRSASGRVA